ncbi:MAG: glycosyltransferase [Candidatus Saccharimonas sp.]
MGYDDADFSLNISNEKQNNILVAPFSMMMLGPKPRQQINHLFSKIIYDSTFSKVQGDKTLQSMTSVYVNPLLDDLATAAVKSETRSGEYNFLHISNGLYWVKGVDLIIKAFLLTFFDTDPVKLTLVLKNSDYRFNKIHEQFKQLGREHQLALVSNTVNHRDINNIYTLADCYVCASRYDTFSMPTLEAASLGLSVIAHRHGGMRDYLNVSMPEQYIPLRTKEITVPAGIWRGNIEVTSREPTITSLQEAFSAAFKRGITLNRRTNDALIKRFSSTRRGITAIKGIL